MGASKFSGLFSKNPDFFDGEGKLSRDSKTAGMPDLYALLLEAAQEHINYNKVVDGAAATASAEVAIYYNDKFVKSMRTVTIVPAAALVADSTNFATIIFRIRNADGSLKNICAQLTTKLVGAGGSGNWTQNVPVVVPLTDGTLALGLDAAKLDIPVGGQLTMEITKGGTGVAVPTSLFQATAL